VEKTGEARCAGQGSVKKIMLHEGTHKPNINGPQLLNQFFAEAQSSQRKARSKSGSRKVRKDRKEKIRNKYFCL
jgi:hypothetical protein